VNVDWVAGSVRARAMTRRRLGRPAVRDLAASPSVEAALSALAHTPYGHDIRPDHTLAEAQRAVVDTVLWNLRVLAGWVPREGVTILRVLVGAAEAANTEDHLQKLAGDEPPSPYRLGGLATAWPRLARTTRVDELRRVLATSPWGDPGGETPRDVGLAMRTVLADRTIAAVPAAGAWAAGATALLVARVVLLDHRELGPHARIAATRVVGAAAVSAHTLPELIAALPTSARWALAGVQEPTDLWQAEARWWTRVERDGHALVRRATAGPEMLVGAVAMMATDAWRVRAALELASRGGAPMELFDAVA
jgi:hypothetical protein